MTDKVLLDTSKELHRILGIATTDRTEQFLILGVINSLIQLEANREEKEKNAQTL